MRILYALLFLCCFSFNVCGQEPVAGVIRQKTYWMPEKYVAAILEHKDLAAKPALCYPVESIGIFNNDVYVQTLYGKYVRISYKKTAQFNRLELLNIRDHMNLAHFSREQLRYFDTTRIFLTINPAILRLELQTAHHTDTVNFIIPVTAHRHERADIAQTRLLLAGKYKVTDKPHPGEERIDIAPDGKISGSSEWSKYVVIRTNVQLEGDITDAGPFNIAVKLWNRQGKAGDLLLVYQQQTGVWYGYGYKMSEKHNAILQKEHEVVFIPRQE
jgi:hypothetical protein